MKTDLIKQYVEEKAFDNFNAKDSVERDTQFYWGILDLVLDPGQQNEYIRWYHACKSIFRQHRDKSC